MAIEFRIVELQEQPGLAITEQVAFWSIGKKWGELFGELMAHFQKNGIQMAGPPFTVYRSWGTMKVTMEVGLPVAEPSKAVGDGRVKAMSLPAGKAVTGVYVGPYGKISSGYKEMQEWMAAQKVKPAGAMWEVYLTDPEIEKDQSKLQTQIFWPIEP